MINIKKIFEKQGYIKLNLIDKKSLLNFENCLSQIIKNKILKIEPLFFKKKNYKKYILNEGMIFLEKNNHSNLVEIYNEVPKTNFFYQISNNKKLNKIIGYLLTGNKQNTPIHYNSDTLRIDIPGITPFLYGWHSDNNSNIKNSNFIQMWMPIINPINLNLGGLHIVEKSHQLNLDTDHTKVELNKRYKKNFALRAKFEAKILYEGKLKKKVLSVKLGDTLIPKYIEKFKI